MKWTKKNQKSKVKWTFYSNKFSKNTQQSKIIQKSPQKSKFTPKRTQQISFSQESEINTKKYFFSFQKNVLGEVGLLKTSLLRRLQAQTLPNATPPIGKILPFSKIAITFDPIVRFGCPLRLRISKKKKFDVVYFMTESTIYNHEGVASP